jgi:hypothetical protein
MCEFRLGFLSCIYIYKTILLYWKEKEKNYNKHIELFFHVIKRLMEVWAKPNSKSLGISQSHLGLNGSPI